MALSFLEADKTSTLHNSKNIPDVKQIVSKIRKVHVFFSCILLMSPLFWDAPIFTWKNGFTLLQLFCNWSCFYTLTLANLHLWYKIDDIWRHLMNDGITIVHCFVIFHLFCQLFYYLPVYYFPFQVIGYFSSD